MFHRKFTAWFMVFNILIHFLDGFGQGKTLDPIYWNSSNSLFRSISRRRHYHLNAGINDKLDLICPRRDRGDGEELFYFKLYLVDEESFRQCNASSGTRLLTCDVPEREKKYTFFFQEISPSPWGLEFEPGKSYYVISTSDGSPSGMDGMKGGVCTQFNMRIELRIHEKEDSNVIASVRPRPNPPKVTNTNANFNQNKEKEPTFTNNDFDVNHEKQPQEQPPKVVKEKQSSTGNSPDDQVSGNGLIIGIVLGACAVLFILLVAFFGHKVYKRRRHHKKYHSPPTSPRDPHNMQEVTLLRIAPPHRHPRLHSDDCHRTATISSHADMRPPPSYNESFLDNGGPVVAV